MQIGVLTVLFQNDPFEKALDKVKSYGVSAIEIGTGCYPGNAHLDLDGLLASESARKEYLDLIKSKGLFISALSCHGEVLSPDKATAQEADQTFRKTIQLASLLNVPVVNNFSGIPAGAPGEKTPNWITCPWPPYYAEMLEYQWNDVAIPYWKYAGKFAQDHDIKIGIEMHPGQLVYNVETMLKLHKNTNPAVGCNFDPSHLFWNGVNPIAAIRALGNTIYHVHGKDSYVDPINVDINGCNDTKSYDQIADRAWTFRTIGYGHNEQTWRDIATALRLVGYNYVISIEHEDALMSSHEGLSKAVELLKKTVMFEKPGEMFWA